MKVIREFDENTTALVSARVIEVNRPRNTVGSCEDVFVAVSANAEWLKTRARKFSAASRKAETKAGGEILRIAERHLKSSPRDGRNCVLPPKLARDLTEVAKNAASIGSHGRSVASRARLDEPPEADATGTAWPSNYEIVGGHRRYLAVRELAREHPADPRFTTIAALVVSGWMLLRKTRTR